MECDSDLDQLRKLLERLISRRVSTEIVISLKAAKLGGSKATAHAKKWGLAEAQRELAQIAYHATNPDYAGSVEEAEQQLLANQIERELLHYYDRGRECRRERRVGSRCVTPKGQGLGVRK